MSNARSTTARMRALLGEARALIERMEAELEAIEREDEAIEAPRAALEFDFKDHLTIGQACLLTGFSRQTLKRLAKKHPTLGWPIPNNRIRFSRRALLAHMADQQ